MRKISKSITKDKKRKLKTRISKKKEKNAGFLSNIFWEVWNPHTPLPVVEV